MWHFEMSYLQRMMYKCGLSWHLPVFDIFFYLLLEIWEWYDVVCFRLGRPPVCPKLKARVFLMPVTVSHFTLEV